MPLQSLNFFLFVRAYNIVIDLGNREFAILRCGYFQAIVAKKKSAFG